MFLSKLPKLVSSKNKRVGRGLGSGLGKTAGRGAKGQKKRNSVPAGFEGGQLKLIKRLPYRRGIGNRPLRQKITLKEGDLNRVEGSIVNKDSLLKAGLLSKKEFRYEVKIVKGGTLKKKLDLKVKESGSSSQKEPVNG